MRNDFREARHWLIKVGSGVLVRDGIHIDRPTFVSIVEGIDVLLREGHRVTVVSSGAVALGRQVVGSVGSRPRDLPQLQALAALGQAKLIQMYDQELQQYERRAAQVLFGRRDLDGREGYLNARMTLDALNRLGAVPILNENDTVATEGLRFDDNDHLAAMASGLVGADLLVILSDVSGVMQVEVGSNGERVLGERIPEIDAASDLLTEVAGPSSSSHGTGGMISKVRAARTAARLGIPTLIAPGKQLGVLQAIQRGDDVGTLIRPETQNLQGAKVWLDTSALPAGRLICDAGAERAIKERGASLLPSGVKGVDGDFSAGAVVELVSSTGETFARGVCLYTAHEVQKIAGRQSDEIEEILGFRRLDTLIHRDTLVLT